MTILGTDIADWKEMLEDLFGRRFRDIGDQNPYTILCLTLVPFVLAAVAISCFEFCNMDDNERFGHNIIKYHKGPKTRGKTPAEPLVRSSHASTSRYHDCSSTDVQLFRCIGVLAIDFNN